MSAAIVAEALGKSFGPKRALDGLDLHVPAGTVLGLLGPNGAGKTTVVRILSTLLRPDLGRASVGGFDVCRQARAVRSRIGVCGQHTTIDEHLTGYENLEMIGRLYHLGPRSSRDRAERLLVEMDLADAAGRAVRTYSGGMRRRLDLAGALVAEPPVLFLDEPTTGLDPAGRLTVWRLLADLVRRGVTVLLTTQYLEEADQVADRVAVVDRGRVIVEGTADDLKRLVDGDRLAVTIGTHDDLDATAEVLGTIGTGPSTVDERARRISVPVKDGADALLEAVTTLVAAGVRPTDIAVVRPTLDDVFHARTGRDRHQTPT